MIYGYQVSFSTYKNSKYFQNKKQSKTHNNRNDEMSIDDFILEFGLNVGQEKKLKDICNFNLKI